MALSITHAFVSGIADGGDTTLVQPSNWNASHTLTGQVDLTTQVTGALPAVNGGTSFATYALGDVLYSSAANTLAKLGGNTTAAKQFLTQTGTGTVSAAPAWGAITAADVPVFIASGASHAAGLVPDPGVTGGTTKFLREDASWQTVSASPAGASLTLQYNNASAFAGMSGTSWDDTNRSLTLTGATVTASNPILNLTQTWNNAAVAFSGLKLNVTNTLSAAGSLLVDLQVGATSIHSVRKDGIGILSNAAAATALWVYNTVDTPAGPTNYERGVFDWTTTANVLTIGTQNGGTGTARNLKFVVGGTTVLDYGVTTGSWWTVGANGIQMNGNTIVFSTSRLGAGVIDSAGLKVNDSGVNYISSFQHGYVRQTKTTNYTVTDSANGDCGSHFDNIGAGAGVTFTLPASPHVGIVYSFYVAVAQNVVVTANTGQTIRIAGATSTSGGTATNNVIGSYLRITAVSSTLWVAIATPCGTWTLA